ncbi:MAG: hypothetical protein ABIP33_13370 [Pseudolysinimonas sp.]
MSARRSIFASTMLTSTLLASALVLLAGCSAPGSGPATSPATDTGDGGTSPSQASSAPAASGPDACALVTEAVLSASLGRDPGAGVSSPGNGGTGSTTCTYGKAVIVQVSLQPDTYLPATLYSPTTVDGAVAPAVGDRGYVATGATLVVKGQVGVFVTYTPDATIGQGQALAAAIVGAL